MNLFYFWVHRTAHYFQNHYDIRHPFVHLQRINYIRLPLWVMMGWLVITMPVMAANCSTYTVDSSKENYCGCHTNPDHEEYEIFIKAWSVYGDPNDTESGGVSSSPVGQCDDITDETCHSNINSVSDGNMIYVKNSAGTDHFYCLAVFGFPLRSAPYIPIASDSSTPSVPTITLDTGADSGLSNTDRITNDTTPLFIGTAEENSTVIIYNDKHNIVDTAVAIGGNWSVSIADDAALPDGKYSYTAKAIDAAGNVSDLSNVLTITIDTTAAVFFVDTLLTNDKTPQLTGSTDDWKAVIDIRVLTHPAQYLVDAIHNNANRTWVLADNLLSSIDEGSYDIEIAGVDLAGNVSSYHIPNALMLDLTAPNAPSTPDMSSDSDKGTSDSDNITTDPTPEFIGTAETGATVELFYDVSHSLGKVSVVDGVWHITSRKIPQGNHDITAITTDVAGNQSERSTALNIIIKAPSVQNSSQQDYYQFGVSGSQAHIRSIPSGIDCEYGAGDCKAMFYRGTKIKLELVNIQTPTGLTLADYNVIWSGDPDCEDQHIDMQNHINCLVRFYGKPDSSNKDNSNISENTPDSNVPNSNILEDTPDLNEPNSNISENSPDSNVRASNTSQLNFLNFSGNAVLNGGAEDMILGFILDGTGLSDVTLHAEKLEHGVLPQITLNEVLYDASLGFFYGNVLIQEQNTENFILNETLAAGSYTIQMSSTAVSGRGMTGISLQNNQLDLTNISVRGILDDPLILNFIVESQNSRNVTVRSHILQGQVETQMKIINLTTGQILAEHIPQTEDAIVEVSTGAYAVILDTLSGDGIGMIGVDLE